MSDVKAIPRFLNLGSRKPTTVEAFRRKVKSSATNAQSYGPNTFANIVIDTSTPGAFLDTSESAIEFNIEITNSNPYIDYLNLGAAGMASFIEELRIYNQGMPLEEMLQYNMMVEHWMRMGGHAQTKFQMFMENSARAPVLPGQSDLNFVKPPMVDREGVIMHPTFVNMFGDPNTVCQRTEQGNYHSTFNENSNALFTTYGLQKSTGVNTSANATLSGAPVGTRRRPGSNVVPAAFVGADYTINIARTDGPSNYIHNVHTNDSRTIISSAAGNINSHCWSNRLDNSYVTWPSTLRPEPLSKSLVRQQQQENIKRYRIQDYLMYLANVENIPIGVEPAKSFIANDNALQMEKESFNRNAGYSYSSNLNNWNFNAVANPNQTNNAGSIKYHVVLPMFSGLLGVWAEKAFPSMLISPGSFYIQIKWAKLQQACSFAMDPCRRIFGTYRDYVPSCGLSTGYQTEYRGQNIDGTGLSTLPEQGLAPNNSYVVVTANGAKGDDFAWQSVTAMAPPSNRNNQILDDDHNFYRTNLIEMSVATGMNVLRAAAQNVDPIYLPNTIGQGQGFSTGVAKCQYVPRANPWLSGGNGFLVNIDALCPYTAERNVCYGTYLPASQPQSRRTHSSTNTAINDAAINDTSPTYIITDLEYTCQQIIVPDEVTASIVSQAAKTDISIDSQTCHLYRTVCAQSTTQTIILPIKLASANSIHIIFQNVKTQESGYYNSLIGICPFSAYQWTPSTSKYFVGSETKPIYKGISTTNNPFSVQMTIGNELFPHQPITNVQGILQELVRSVHGSGDMNCSLPFTTSIRNNRYEDNLSVVGKRQNEYTCIQSNQFTVPFIPIEALDDQTITNNPLFNDYYDTLPIGTLPLATPPFNVIRTNLAAQDGTVNERKSIMYNDRGTYVYPDFTPPLSTFVLGFDLDTFPGQSDQARSGRYLGNAPLTLQMSNCYGLNNTSIVGGPMDPTIATAIVLHDCRFSIGSGGTVMTYF